MPVIIKNLKYVYNSGDPFESCAIKNISLTIADHEIVGIIGPTGCGKSTLIQHINALLLPTEGSVTVNGIDTTEKGERLRNLRREVGMVFQYPEYQLFEETIRKDIEFGPKNLGYSDEETEKQVREAMEMVSLDYDTYAEVSPFELSGGQKRRAAIAGVLAMKPSILILDEPAAGMDPRGRESIHKIINHYYDKYNATIIMISHSMDEVANICRRIIVLNNGEVAMQGTPAEVFAHGKELSQLGLDIPAAAKIANMLRERGFNVPSDIINTEQLTDWIQQNAGVNANA